MSEKEPETVKPPAHVKEPSAEYQNFETLLKQVASVPKAEVDRRVQAEKEASRKK